MSDKMVAGMKVGNYLVLSKLYACFETFAY